MNEAPSIWWYGVNSLFAPRSAARCLKQDSRLPGIAWKLVAMGLVALFVASFAVNALADIFLSHLMAVNPPMLGLGLAGRVIEAALYVGLTYLSIRLSIYIWSGVLKYREPPFAVLSATALTAAVMLILSPLQEVIYIVVTNASLEVGTAAFLANMILVLALIATYYAETLTISYGSALLRSALVTLVVIVILALFLIFASLLIWGIGGAFLFPMDVG